MEQNYLACGLAAIIFTRASFGIMLRNDKNASINIAISFKFIYDKLGFFMTRFEVKSFYISHKPHFYDPKNFFGFNAAASIPGNTVSKNTQRRNLQNDRITFT